MAGRKAVSPSASQDTEPTPNVLEPDTTPELNLLLDKLPELKTQSKDELKLECTMWRKLFKLLPSEVKYYFARMGATVGLTMRNYRRHLGTLIGTHWDLLDLELGVYEKQYDTQTGKYFWEDKIIKIPIANIIAFEWIAKREPEDEILAESTVTEEETPS